MMLLLVLLSLASSGLTLRCDSTLTATQCEKLKLASESLSKVTHTADMVLGESITQMSVQISNILSSLIPVLQSEFKPSAKMTKEEFEKLTKDLLDSFKSLNTIGDLLKGVDFDKVTGEVEQALTGALTSSPNAYGIIPMTFDELKQKIASLFSGSFLKAIVVKALEKYHNHLDRVISYLDLILSRVPFAGSVWAKYKPLIHNLIDNFINQVGSAAALLDVVSEEAQSNMYSLIDEFEKQVDGTKRSVVIDFFRQRVWNKLQETINKLKVGVKEATLKVVEEYKPKVMEALKNLKNIVIEAGKKIIITVIGQTVKIVVGELETIVST